MNWGGNAVELERPVQSMSIIPELRLNSKTNYKDAYAGLQTERVKCIKKKEG